MDKREQKKLLRAQIKEKNKALTAEYRKRADQRITEKITELSAYQKADTVFCFVGVRYEPDTSGIIDHAIQAGKRVCVPLCTSKTEMVAKVITDPAKDLEESFYDLLEPRKELPEVAREEIDFAVIPCVSCDHKGNRLGHGAGYYDRYLEGMSAELAMICYEEVTCKEGEIPMDQYDLPIETVITDR